MTNTVEVNAYIDFSFFRMLINNSNSLKAFFLWQGNFSKDEMSKRQKKKAPSAEGDPKVEIITKVEYIYEDTRATTGVEPNYNWGDIYILISNQEVPDTGFEELTIYANIEKSALMKIATRLAFPMLRSDWMDYA